MSQDIIDSCINVLNNKNIGITERMIDINTIFQTQTQFFEKTIGKFDKIKNQFNTKKFNVLDYPLVQTDWKKIKTIIESKSQSIYFFVEKGKYNNKYIVFGADYLMINTFDSETKKNYSVYFKDIELANGLFEWQLLINIINSDNLVDINKDYNRIIKKIKTDLIDSESRELTIKARRLENEISEGKKASSDVNIANTIKVLDMVNNVLTPYVSNTLESFNKIPVGKFLEKEEKEIEEIKVKPDDYINKYTEKINKLKKKKKDSKDKNKIKDYDNDIDKYSKKKKKRETKIENENKQQKDILLKNIYFKKQIKAFFSGGDRPEILGIKLSDIITLKKITPNTIENIMKVARDNISVETSSTKSKNKLACDEKELASLRTQLTELEKEKSKEEEIAKTNVNCINENDSNSWTQFEKYLFDVETYERYIFSLNCCLNFHLLVCVCTNDNFNNDINMLLMLNNINKINIPKSMSNEKHTSTSDDFIEFINETRNECLMKEIDNMRTYFKNYELDGYLDSGVNVLAHIEKLWIFLNYKNKTKIVQSNDKILINSDQTNEYVHAPLLIDNKLTSFDTGITIDNILGLIKKFTSDVKNMDLLFELINEIYEFVVIEKNVNLYSWIMITFLLKVPLEIYNNPLTNLELFKLCEHYKRWYKLCSLTNKIHIYKYSYFLLINKNLIKLGVNLPDNKNSLLAEFYNDVNTLPITDNNSYLDIQKIVACINDPDIKMWYNSNEDLFLINKYLSEMINGNYDMIFKNIKLYENTNVLIDNSEQLNNLSHANTINDGQFYSVLKKTQEIDEKEYLNLINTKRIYDSQLINLLFPNFNEYNESDNNLTITLGLIQIMHSCKELDTEKFYYPTCIPQLIFNSGEKIILKEEYYNNNFYLNIVKLPKLKEKNIYPIEPTNTEYNLTSCNNLSDNYLNTFVSVVQSRNFEYLKIPQDVLPFVKYGYNIAGDEVSIPIKYEIDNNEKISNKSLYTKKLLISNLLINDDFIKKCDDMFDIIHKKIVSVDRAEPIEYDKFDYNIFIFIYLFIRNDVGLNEIIENNLYSIENIGISKMSELYKLMCISNCIKYYSDNPSKLSEYINYLDSIAKTSNVYSIGKCDIAIRVKTETPYKKLFTVLEPEVDGKKIMIGEKKQFIYQLYDYVKTNVCEFREKDKNIEKLLLYLQEISIDKSELTEKYWKNKKYEYDFLFKTKKIKIGNSYKKTNDLNLNNIQNFIFQHISAFLVNKEKYNYDGGVINNLSIQPFEKLKVIKLDKTNGIIQGSNLFNYYSTKEKSDYTDDKITFFGLLNKRFKDDGRLVYEKSDGVIKTKFGSIEYVYKKDKSELLDIKAKIGETKINVKYDVHKNNLQHVDIVYNELKSISIGDITFKNNMSFLDNDFIVNIIDKSKLEFRSPYFIPNKYINNNFKWTVQYDKFIGVPVDTKITYSLVINLADPEYKVKKVINEIETDEELYFIDNILLESKNIKVIQLLKKIINFTKDEQFFNLESIFLWKTGDYITSIDLLTINLLLTYKEDSWYINDLYKLIDSDKLIKEEKIIRWLSNVENFFLVEDNDTEKFLYICPYIEHYDTNYKCINNPDIEKILVSKDNSSIIGRLEQLYKQTPINIIQLNPTTSYPIIMDKSILEILFLNYLLVNNYSNVFDLMNCIRKYEIEFEKYSVLLKESNDFLNKYLNIKISSSNLQKEIVNKFEMKTYEKEFLIIKDVEKYELNYNYNYYFSKKNIYPTQTEYWVYSLYDNDLTSDKHKKSDVAFSICYKKLIDNYKNKNIDNAHSEIIELYEGLTNFKTNPLEFYYQYLLGFFARPEQKMLVNEIIDDITRKKIVETETTMTGGYIFYSKYFINKLMYESEETNKRGNIHCLIMGGGKTKMITPLVIIKYFQQISFNQEGIDAGNHIYLVLPDYLVAQSFEYLSQIFNLYYPMRVNLLKESRGEIKGYERYSDTVSKKNSNELQIYIMSDLTMKSGFLNNYKTIKENSSSHVYIFDEVDTIIEPLISELNYPLNEKINLENLSSYYYLIYSILNSIFKSNEEFLSKIADYSDFYELKPHFNIIDNNDKLYKIIQDFVLDKIIDYFSDKNTIISDIFKNYKINSISDVSLVNEYISTELGQKNIGLLYTLFNFLNEILPVVLNKINRKDYGLITKEIPDEQKTEDHLVALPFTYADTPKIGSLFSNPLLTMCLTIIDYIVQIEPLNNYVIKKMVEQIVNKYDGTSYTQRKYLTFVKKYNSLDLNVNISDLRDYTNLDILSINKLRHSEYFVMDICFLACSTITFNEIQENIAGVDLFMHMNINKKSGFTGTPNISKFYDLEKKNEIKVKKVSEKTNKLIMDSLTKASIQKIDFTNTQIKYLEKILELNLSISSDGYYCNTLIDVGAICLGINVISIQKLVKKYNPELKQFIYWNYSDVPYCIDNYGNNFLWNKVVSNNNEMFYFYDNKHTTGIDATIPMKSLGLVLLGKSSRFRDVVQGIYRMRKLNVVQGHKIKFILNNKIYNSVCKLYDVPELDIGMLINWFKKEEENFSYIQQKALGVQNVRSLWRYFYNTNEFTIKNTFYYPYGISDLEVVSDLIVGKKTYTNIEILEKIKNIMDDKSKDKSHITNFLLQTQKELQKINISNTESTSVSQSQNQSQNQTQNVQLNIEVNTIDNSLFDGVTHLISLNNFNEYFILTNYYRLVSEYYDKKFYISTNIKFYVKSPYIILYCENNYFMIPYIEGIKLLENIPEIKCMIFDTDNTVYFNNIPDSNNILSIGKIFFKKMVNTIYLDDYDYMLIAKMNDIKIYDYLSSIKSSNSKFNQFKLLTESIQKLSAEEKIILNEYNTNDKSRSEIYSSSSGNLKLIFDFFTYGGSILKHINMIGGLITKRYKIKKK
jgi:hypothetical protein